MTTTGPLRQPIPVGRSILWTPAHEGAKQPGESNIPFPVFVSQAAFNAIQEHLTTPQRQGQGILGFLLGDQCECPETGIAYLVVEVALRLNQPIYGDRTRDVVTRLWDHINAQLEEQRASLIGWYHSHPPLPLALSGHDLETHEHYFAEPWQVALLLGADPADPAGAFFRAGSDESWLETPLPFYELLSPESIRPDGKKRSSVPWKNYRAQVAPSALTPAAPKPPSAPPPPPRPREAVRAAAPPPAPAEPEDVDEPEHDSGELKFLTAAEDMPPPQRPAPSAAAPAPPPVPPPHAMPSPPRRHTPPPSAAPPPPPAPAPAAEAEPALAWPDEFEERDGVEQEVPEEAEPAPAPVRRKRSRRHWRGLVRTLVIVVLIGAGAGAYWYFQPQLSVPVGVLRGAWSAITKKGAALASSVAALKRTLKQPAAAPRQPARPAATPARSAPPPPLPPPPPPPPPGPPPPPAAPSPYARLDRSGDSLALLVRAFAERRDQFSRGQLPCPGLAHGLAAVENGWIAYNTARRSARILDAAHAARDQALYAGVDSVERRFEQTGCARP